ncbi:hypothetical protein AMTR_s00022p00237210 [Amborella trichopoda]|uniref:Aminotransferase-like plant mobile domain-containing protein n=1 Tax=Amborella trichopoda TaxID=13333 RepID=W1PVL3_AMBTC|nr:hypothetical protein AMTR_s00022p00237210 [Amborella trichopoda]
MSIQRGDTQEVLRTLARYSFIQSIHHITYGKERELPPDASPVQIVRYTRAYLFFLINVTIFVNASVATVPTRYLQFFEDIEKANIYAWGVAALVYLYRSLGKTCTFKRRHFSGSAILMQVIWNPYFKPDEATSDDRHEAFQTAMCVTTLIFDDIAEPYPIWS